ncbi:MAG: UTP--glucose-1-phosphate uridylyltransferase, partial [Pirellulales bacterium]|nr:UTP--glucose-1-phosphate uridylyltransferase [Pirellulales bacterium]
MRDAIEQRLHEYGQEHLLAFWDQLDARQQAALADEIRSVDLSLIARLYKDRDTCPHAEDVLRQATSPTAFRLDSAQNAFSCEQSRRCAIEALRAGRLGVILVAGGHGTRLGFDQPKGMYPIGPLSRKTLFQLHVEKIVAAARRWGVRIPFYLMTSPATDEPTRAFFDKHDRFGLAEEDLWIFCQGTMPAVDAATGKILLAEPGHLALSPDGHGGMLAALAASGALDDARQRGVEQLFYFQVDNPLVDIGGPEFVGYHLLSRSELSSQVVAKRDPFEAVGNVVSVDDHLHVIEYSDLPDDVAQRRGPDGSLAIWAGSIAVHVMDVAFLERMVQKADSLPFHCATKTVAHVDAQGRPIEPTESNAIKFERFIFDLLPSAERAIVVEVDRNEAFAPLKNASGERADTPETVRARMISQHAAWLRRAGAEL